MKKVKASDEHRRGEKTLLKKSKETLRQSEEKFRALFDCAKDAIYVLDQKGRILEVNQAGCEALGYSREELVEMNPLDIDMSGQANLGRMETLQRQGHILFETLNRRRDGTLMPVEVSLQVIEWAGKQRILAVCRDITRRNRIEEEALRESEQRFRAILERTTDWVWEMDLNGVHTFSNPAMTTILDYRLEEFIELTVASLLHEEDRAEVEAKLPQLMAEKRGWRGWVLRWRHKDGSFRFLESNANPIIDTTGRLQGYRGVDRDITKRKLAEAALVESEKRFSVFMAHLPAGAFLKDHEGRLLFTNRYLKELFDWRDCIGKTTEELVPPEIAERMIADDRKALTEGPMVLQERITDIHGAERFFETYKFPIEVEGSPALLGGITVDITERKRVEEALLLMQFTMDQAPDSILLVGDQGNLEYANDAACASMCYTREELLSMTVFDIDPDFPIDGWEQHKKDLKRLGRMTIEGRHRTKDGRLFPVEVTTNYLEYKGRFLGVAFDRDITDRKLAEQALRQANLVVESSPVVLFRWRAAEGWPFTMVSRNVILFGYTVQELLSGTISFASIVHPEDLDRVAREVREYSASGVDSFQQEYRIVTKDSGVRWVDGRTVAERDPEGQIAFYQGIIMDITERKRVEEALEKRIVALTQPLTNVKSIAFEDLFNLHDLQRLQDLFADAWGVAALITSPEGAPITQPSNFTYFCSEFIRRTEKGSRNCQMSDTALGRHNPSGPIIQTCLSAGLWGAGASITVEGRHIANWLIGQVRNEAQNEKHIMKYAREIGADETVFREAYLKVPIMAQEKFGQIAQALFALANQLSSRAYQNIQQARFITERKQAEETLRESERKLNEAQKIAQLGHWTWNVKTGDVEWSDEVFKIFRLDPKSFTPRIDSIMALSPWPEDYERDKELIRKATESHEKGSYEQRFIRPDKSIGYYSSSFQGKYDNNGNLVSIVGTVQDITERKKIEEELRRSEEKIKEAQRIARLVNWELDLTKKTLKWSDGICELLEINPMESGVSEFGVSYEAFLNTIHPDDREIVSHVYNESLKNRTPFKISHRILMKDGRIKWVNEIGRNEYDQQGNPIKSYGIVQDITELKQAEEMMRHMASHDGLTDLPTLKLAKDRLAMAMGMARRSKKKVAVMFVDLDEFKAVNDTYGHDVGDEVLREAAKRFCSCVRAIDTVARIGGDEFLIVITELQSWKSVAGIAEKVIQSVSQPIMINGLRTSVGASIGIAMFPGDSDDADRLIKLADKAMYRMKKSGKNSYAFATAAK